VTIETKPAPSQLFAKPTTSAWKCSSDWAMIPVATTTCAAPACCHRSLLQSRMRQRQPVSAELLSPHELLAANREGYLFPLMAGGLPGE